MALMRSAPKSIGVKTSAPKRIDFQTSAPKYIDFKMLPLKRRGQTVDAKTIQLPLSRHAAYKKNGQDFYIFFDGHMRPFP